MSDSNGNGAGPIQISAPAPLTTHVIRDSGVVVKIDKVNPLIFRLVQKNFPPPKPPLEAVTYGDHVVMEPNEASPTYIAEMEAYKEEVQIRQIQLLITRGVIFEMTPERVEEVRKLRRDLEVYAHTDLPEDDKQAWLMYCAIKTDDDMKELIEAISSRVHPTEKVIREHVESFQGEV